MLTARVGVAASGDDPVHAIALRCQVRIEPLRRSYSDDEAAGLLDLFGPRERWATHPTHLPLAALHRDGAGLRRRHRRWRFRWTAPTTSRSPPPSTCTRCATASLPLQFLFSGTIFVKSERGFSVQQVSWDCEDRYDMPVTVWRDLIAQHYPNTGWVRLSHDTVAALAAYKSAQGHARPRPRDHTRCWTTRPGERRSDFDVDLGPRPRRRRRGALRGLPALPVPRDIEQEPIPLAVRRFGSARRGRARAWAKTTRWRRSSWSTAPGRSTLVVRFLQLQHRRAEREFADGEFEPVDELTTASGSWLTWDEAVECETVLRPACIRRCRPWTLPVVGAAGNRHRAARRRPPGPRTARGSRRTDGLRAAGRRPAPGLGAGQQCRRRGERRQERS